MPTACVIIAVSTYTCCHGRSSRSYECSTKSEAQVPIAATTAFATAPGSRWRIPTRSTVNSAYRMPRFAVRSVDAMVDTVQSIYIEVTVSARASRIGNGGSHLAIALWHVRADGRRNQAGEVRGERREGLSQQDVDGRRRQQRDRDGGGAPVARDDQRRRRDAGESEVFGSAVVADPPTGRNPALVVMAVHRPLRAGPPRPQLQTAARGVGRRVERRSGEADGECDSQG